MRHVYLLDSNSVHRVDKAFSSKRKLINYIKDHINPHVKSWQEYYGIIELEKNLKDKPDSYGNAYTLGYHAKSGANVYLKVVVLTLNKGV